MREEPMSDDDLTEEQIRKMEARLLGHGEARKSTVAIRSRRKSPVPKKVRPHIEVEGIPDRWSSEENKYLLFLVSPTGRFKLKEGLYREELEAEIAKYKAEGTEIRYIDAHGMKWVERI
jgi:hypothetical protein